MDISVLFLVFRRPETTRLVFSAIREARPSKLYVAADGPRTDRPGEAELCAEVRAIATAVDWPCEIKTLFREKNLGGPKANSEAITWFFENEEEGIIIEDDGLPDPSFFEFSKQLLEKYRTDERVMSIGGMHAHESAHQPEESYFFSRYTYSEAWASWRRAWNLFDRDMSLWPKFKDTDWLYAQGNGNRSFQEYWSAIFNRVHEACKVEKGNWDYRWLFSCWSQNGLTILPSRNLVTNLGFGPGAQHTTGPEPYSNRSLESMPFPLQHPRYMSADVSADFWLDRHIFEIGLEEIICGDVLKGRPVFFLGPLSMRGERHGFRIAAGCDNPVAVIDDVRTEDTIHGVPRWTSAQFLSLAGKYPNAIAVDFTTSKKAHVWANALCKESGVDYINFASM
jgi:hypothetical protein